MTPTKKFIRTAQGILILSGLTLLVGPMAFFPDYYRPGLMGITALLYSFLIQLPALVFPAPSSGVERLQASLSVGFLLGGLGSLGLWGLHEVGIPYDKLIHFIFPMLIIVPGFSLLRAAYGWSGKKTLILLVLVAGVCGIAWEYVEYGLDRWLHFGFFGQLFDRDSVLDVFATFLGIGTAAVFLASRARSRKQKQEYASRIAEIVQR